MRAARHHIDKMITFLISPVVIVVSGSLLLHGHNICSNPGAFECQAHLVAEIQAPTSTATSAAPAFVKLAST